MRTVSLVPLTPLWTGNESGISDQLRVTGLMGSLRWWFEGLVRAHGHHACDPTAGGCLYQSGSKDPAQLCAACWLFGTTGWSRRFRLTASGLHAEPWYILANPAIARMHENWLSRLTKPDSKVLWGTELRLTFGPHFGGPSDSRAALAEALLLNTLSLVSRFGALGAKTQNGLGAVRLKNPGDFVRGAWQKFLNEQPREVEPRGNNEPEWFDLSRTVFFDIQVPDPGVYISRSVGKYPAQARATWESRVLPIAYDIRYKSRARNFRSGQGEDVGLRPALKEALAPLLRGAGMIEDIVGSAARSEDRTASRVFVTHLYREAPTETYRFRIWINVPREMGIEPEDAVQPVQELVELMFPHARVTPFFWADVQREVG